MTAEDLEASKIMEEKFSMTQNMQRQKAEEAKQLEVEVSQLEESFKFESENVEEVAGELESQENLKIQLEREISEQANKVQRAQNQLERYCHLVGIRFITWD
jgi:adenylyl- and sulfurtransferase ThiI